MQVTAFIKISYVFATKQSSIVWMNQFIHPTIEGHMGCFQFWATVEKKAVSIRVCKFSFSLDS